jgi:hypothetical protein
MKPIIVYLLGLALAAAPVMAAQQQGNVITLEPHEVAGCEAGGGCILIPKAALREALQQAQAANCTRI